MENFIDSQVAEDVVNSLTQEPADAYNTDDAESIMNQAVMRIEEANLFKLLISADVFAENSARPEILESVKSKLKQFAIKELQELLGMKREEAAPVMRQDFDNEEVAALKIVAGKVLKRDPSVTADSATPALVPVATAPVNPQIKQVQIKSPNQHLPAKPQSTPKRTPASNNKSGSRTKTPDFSKVDKGFALPSGGAQRKPMPTVEQAIAGMGMSRPNISTDGDGQGAVQVTQNLLGNILQSLTGGQQVHVDTSAPSDTVQGDDVNGRI